MLVDEQRVTESSSFFWGVSLEKWAEKKKTRNAAFPLVGNEEPLNHLQIVIRVQIRTFAYGPDVG